MFCKKTHVSLKRVEDPLSLLNSPENTLMLLYGLVKSLFILLDLAENTLILSKICQIIHVYALRFRIDYQIWYSERVFSGDFNSTGGFSAHYNETGGFSCKMMISTGFFFFGNLPHTKQENFGLHAKWHSCTEKHVI